MTKTKSLTVRGISEDILKRIKVQAEENFRSMNSEILAILQKGVK